MARFMTLGAWAVEGAFSSSSFIFESDGEKLLIDTCPSICKQLHKADVKLTDIDTCFLTHCHGDHLAGFPYAIFKRGVEARAAKHTVAPMTVIGSQETVEAAKTMLAVLYPDREFEVIWRVVGAGDTVDIGFCRISPTPTDHTVASFGLRIQTESCEIGHTGDTALFDGIEKLYEGVDLLVAEAFGREEDFQAVASAQKHLLAHEAGQLAARCGARRVLLFHMHVPYQQEAKMAALVDDVKRFYNGEVIPAEDLLEIEI